MALPLLKLVQVLASPQGRRAMKRANEEVRKQLADPKNQERIAKAKEQVQKQLADPKNKERLDSLKTRLTGKDTGPGKPGDATKK